MTDRVQSLTVVLDEDYRTDDVQAIVDAIRMLRGVRGVELGEPLSVPEYFARQRVGYDIRAVVTEAMDSYIAGKNG